MIRRIFIALTLAAVAGGLALALSVGGLSNAPGGKTTRSEPPDTLTLGVPGRSNATPWIAADGRFVAVAWGATAAGKTDVFVAVSRDSGRTFAPPVQVNTVAGEARLGGELPPRVAIASHPGTTAPEVVVLWTARAGATEIKMARSADGGLTFAQPVVLQSRGAAGDRGWTALSLDRRGAVHAIWLDHRELAAGRANDAARTHREHGAGHDGVAMAQKSGLYYAAVRDVPGPERELAKGVCYCCKTALATRDGGMIFAAWRHVYPGNLRDIALAVSRDGGNTFGTPVRVSEDNWAINGCPDDGPAMAVDEEGTVHVIWPTVIDGPQPEGALFHTSTRDGRTFSTRTRIPTLGSPKPAHPQVLADGAGRLVVAWDEYVEGKRVGALRRLHLRGDAPPTFGEIISIAIDGPAIYPVLAAAGGEVLAAWSTGGDPSAVKIRTVRMR
jgi:hypothetical protein